MTTWLDCGHCPPPKMLNLAGCLNSEESMKKYGVMPIPAAGSNLDNLAWLSDQQKQNIRDSWENS